ncbi:MAG: adenine deaminase C-terminal domain-containing protein [Oscillospiraceae bacterium]|nr:adenine deaminase C-terminal domain-containing protein [Oscillospiraceae bacterium]
MDMSEEKKAIRRRRMIDTLLGGGSADLVFHGGNVIDVLTREIYPADVAVKDEFILYVGDCSFLTGQKTTVVDVEGKFLSPGFIDAHMHFESSMLTPTEFSRLSLPTGTTTVFADPHEIGNVLGVDGIVEMIKEARTLPNRVLFTVPALVPDLPGLETPGREINSQNIEGLLDDSLVCGLGEMQGFSNVKPVYAYASSLLDDMLISVLESKKRGKSVEGNAPGLSDAELAAHNILCGGHASCHETVTKEECAEKLRCGYTVFMREGSTQKNMKECIRVITEDGMDSRHLAFATDDMVAEDLLTAGHIDEILRRAVACGVDPVEAIQMATINPAEHYGKKEIGALSPGCAADICVISDLAAMRVDEVYVAGKTAAKDGKLLLDLPRWKYPDTVKNTMKCPRVSVQQLQVPSGHSSERVRVIKVIPEQNLTDALEAELPVQDGFLVPSTQQDVLPLLSIERHGRSSGRIAHGFVQGMGLKAGAIAQSIAHDTHNLLVCGANYIDMKMAADRVIAMGGGIALVKNGRVAGDLSLPIGGLMTDALTGAEVAEKIRLLNEIAKTELGCTLPSPFMHLSFLSLATSPKWKLTDKGIVDVASGKILPVLLSGEREKM